MAQSVGGVGDSAMSRSSSSNGSAFGVLVVLGVIVSIILRYIGPILGLLAIAASIYGARAILRENRRIKDEYADYCAKVAATADKQDEWVRQGDMRGVFGPDAADLMDYVRDDGSVTPPKRPLRAAPAPQPLSRARQAAAPGLVAGGVGAALLLAQIPGIGSDSSPTRSTTTSRTSVPTYSTPTYSTQTMTPTWRTPVTTSDLPTTSYYPTPTWTPTPETTTVYVVPPPPPQTSTVLPIAPLVPSGGDVYYRSCAVARADGRSNIPIGAPGYRPGLDRDGDGVACES